MRALLLRSACPWALAWVLAAAPVIGAPASATLSSDIAPQNLGAALRAFNESTGLSVSWPPEMAMLPSPGAPSGLPLEKALEQLLRDTGLTFERLTEGSIRVYAQSEGGAPPPPTPPPEPPVPEILVTSSRWDKRVKDPPIDLATLSDEEMQLAGIKGIADIGARTPGVAFDFFSSVGSGVYTDIIIRGVTDRHGSATGVFFDDIPLPSARSNTFGRALPPSFDLSSVEVLRGPQGTLLGADTQGGAVRFEPNQPSLTAYTAQAHAELATTERGEPSYEAGAAAGGPLVAGVLGFRFSAWRRSDGGYVDRVNPFTDTIVDPNANRDTSQSVRGVLTYAPNPSWKISPSINYVSSSAHDSPSFFTYLSDPGAGILENGSLVQQPFNDRYHVGSLRILGETPLGQLDSHTSYYHRSGDLVVDDTESVKWSAPPAGPPCTGWGNRLGCAYPVSYANAVTTVTALRQSVLSQELRFTRPDLTWGASYYKIRDTEGYQVTGASIPLFGGAPLDAENATHTLATRLAGFAQVSKRFSRHFTLGAGLRVEHEKYDSAEDESAQTELSVYGITPPSPPLHASAGETIVAPKMFLTYQSDAHDRYYLLVARGYAPAGVDAALPTCFEDLQPYPSDSLWNYELGSSLSLLEGLAVETSVFEERWNNGPTFTTNCLVNHIPGPAVSRGFNLRAVGKAGDLLLRFEVAYTDAYYAATESFDGQVIVNEGDALGTPPLVVSPWQVLGSLEKSLTLRDGLQATLRAEDAFHSHNPGPFYTGIVHPVGFIPNYAPGLAGDPATNLVNLRAILSVRAPNPLPALCHCAADEPASFDIAIYLNNAFDSQPTLLKRNKGADANNLYYATTFRPRTVGLAGTWRF